MTAHDGPSDVLTSSSVAASATDAVKVYGSGPTAVRALDGLTVSFGRGEFTAIMGPSGSGKSTLMHCMAGLDRLTEGSVRIGDEELGSLNENQLTLMRRRHVGFVFQAYNLIPTLDALENITLPLALGGDRPDQGWLDEVISAVALQDRLTHRPGELSGGQQQRVAVARALITRPTIVFADEPTGNLDTRTSGEILEFMRSATDSFGQTIVMVTHDPIAAAHADRVVFLADGLTISEIREPTAEMLIDEMKQLGG